MLCYRRSNVGVIGRNYDFRRAACTCTLGDIDDHGTTGEVGQHFAWQPRRRVPGGNDDAEGGH